MLQKEHQLQFLVTVGARAIVVDATRNIYKFQSSADLQTAKRNVRQMLDNGAQWTLPIQGHPSLFEYLVVMPKNASSVEYYVEEFP